MHRDVTAHLELYLHGDADLIFSVAVAEAEGLDVEETLEISSGGTSLEAHEVAGRHGTRLHRLTGPPGPLVLDYAATVVGRAEPVAVDELELIEYRRPSRYCESDTLFATARSELSGLQGKALLDAVAGWVSERLTYLPGASHPTDGAVATLLARAGVCRDYAHLVIALLRAMDVPARLASVYAPGLFPMDFHAVAEAHVEGAWHTADATGLAPRGSLLRIATGQDASETAFLTQHGAAVDLRWMSVSATADVLPEDDPARLVELA